MRAKYLIALSSLYLLYGCVTPTQPDGGLILQPGSRVGVLFTIEDRPTHVLVGTTIFNNDRETIQADWDVESFSLRHIEAGLQGVAEVVRIEPVGKLGTVYSNDMVDAGWSTLKLKEEFKPDIQELGQTHQLDAIIMISPFLYSVHHALSVQAAGYGVWTRCVARVCSSFLLDHVAVTVFSVDPPERVAWGQYVEKDDKLEIQFSKGAAAVSEADIELVRDRFLEVLRRDIVSAIEGAGFLGQ